MDVRANEIAADGSGRLDRVFGPDGWGEGGGSFWTAKDKARLMDCIIIIVETAATADRDGAFVVCAAEDDLYTGFRPPISPACSGRTWVSASGIRGGEEMMSGEQRELRGDAGEGRGGVLVRWPV